MNENEKQEIIVDGKGLIYQLKKPLHKQALFWTTLILGIVLFLMTIFCAVLFLITLGLTVENEELRVKQSHDYSYSAEYKSYRLGEAVEFPEGLKITVNSVRLDKDRTLGDESTGSAVVASVTVENTSSRQILLSPYSFSLYDQDDEVYILDGSTFDNTQIGTNLSAGKTITFDLIFDGEDGDAGPYSLVYENVKWSKEKSSQAV